MHDKRDDFDFDIVNFSFLDSDVPRAISYDVYVSQLIRLDIASCQISNFDNRNQIITAKLLK